VLNEFFHFLINEKKKLKKKSTCRAEMYSPGFHLVPDMLPFVIPFPNF
jgi:hypothetical protein